MTERTAAAWRADTKACPDCAEDVKVAARVCRYCGYQFEPTGTPSPAAVEPIAADWEDTAPSAPPTAAPVPAATASASAIPDRDGRNRWRIVAYVIGVLVWAFTIPPMAVALIDGDGWVEVVPAYFAAVVTWLAIVAIVRFVYARIRKRRCMSPWLFVVAAVFNVLSTIGNS